MKIMTIDWGYGEDGVDGLQFLSQTSSLEATASNMSILLAVGSNVSAIIRN